MRKILVTGGTVFVSRYIAEYYVAKGDEVYVLNRNTRKQSEGVKLIEADRHQLGDVLRDYSFDVIIDTAYNAGDVEELLNAGKIIRPAYVSTNTRLPYVKMEDRK